jgi:hypothetical protein
MERESETIYGYRSTDGCTCVTSSGRVHMHLDRVHSESWRNLASFHACVCVTAIISARGLTRVLHDKKIESEFRVDYSNRLGVLC